MVPSDVKALQERIVPSNCFEQFLTYIAQQHNNLTLACYGFHKISRLPTGNLQSVMRQYENQP